MTPAPASGGQIHIHVIVKGVSGIRYGLWQSNHTAVRVLISWCIRKSGDLQPGRRS